jgi:hypothetical protein
VPALTGVLAEVQLSKAEMVSGPADSDSVSVAVLDAIADIGSTTAINPAARPPTSFLFMMK